MDTTLFSGQDYQQWVVQIKTRIKQAQLRAALKVNEELLALYWELGAELALVEKTTNWGDKFLPRLSRDLSTSFPDLKGFSLTTLKYIRRWHLHYNQPVTISQQLVDQLSELNPWAKGQQPVDQMLLTLLQRIPWGHHIQILTKTRSLEESCFYLIECIHNNWSRSVLVAQIESKLYERKGKAITNFQHTLPDPISDLAKETLKNPYIFGFLAMSEQMQERELENALIHHLKKFMLELVRGFAYVGNQFHLDVQGDDYFLDLLFYNTRLHCYVIFELKLGEFKPEYAGKLNFYINTVDQKIKTPEDKPTIGVLLCKTPNETVVKYALQGINSPMGVSEYEISKALPEIKTEMPSIEEFEQELQKEMDEHKTPTRKKLDVLKERIATLQQEEVKAQATPELLLNILHQSLKPLFTSLIEKLEELKDAFLSTSFYFSGSENLTTLDAMDKEWSSEPFLKDNLELYFQYTFSGFKKGGIDSFNVPVMLYHIRTTYWYGFRSNNKVILKKMYTQQLTIDDINLICDTVMENVIEYMQGQIALLEANK